mmetsp:Transcript_22794/g.64061  ORF Transcript_22794/g.64061 Transcript_22794/m.64061 type:complete len:221 (-) Transcript_22794:1209-1871(-)
MGRMGEFVAGGVIVLVLVSAAFGAKFQFGENSKPQDGKDGPGAHTTTRSSYSRFMGEQIEDLHRCADECGHDLHPVKESVFDPMSIDTCTAECFCQECAYLVAGDEELWERGNVNRKANQFLTCWRLKINDQGHGNSDAKLANHDLHPFVEDTEESERVIDTMNRRANERRDHLYRKFLERRAEKKTEWDIIMSGKRRENDETSEEAAAEDNGGGVMEEL